MRFAPGLALLVVVASSWGCGEGLQSGPQQRATASCGSDQDCAADEVCAGGLCVRAVEQPLPLVPVDDAGPWPRDGGPEIDGGPALDGGAALDGGPAFDGGIAEDAGAALDGGPLADAGRPDGGQDGGVVTADAGPGPDAGVADAGTKSPFCGPCTSDAQCDLGLKCVTTERTGERFCANPCPRGALDCALGTACSRLLVNNADFCIPTAGTCLDGRCQSTGCPSETPTCDATSGRCYRSENRNPCAGCTYSFQCGGFWDRCIQIADGSKRCGRDCDSARGGTCPSGYRCADVQTPTGDTQKQCVPLVGNCSGCRADNVCASGAFCNLPTGQCLNATTVVPACVACEDNSHCGAASATCYQGGCMYYCDTYTPCPTGYRCNVVDDPERGQVRRCTPHVSGGESCETLRFCARCDDGDDCNGGRCQELGGALGKRCLQHCDLGACPSGSSCQRLSGEDYCVPTTCN